MPPNLKELERKFHADGYRLGMQAMRMGQKKDPLFPLIGQLHRMVDEMVGTFSGFAEKYNRVIACKKHCSWCCYQPVFVLSYELDYLKDFLLENYTDAERDRIRARTEAKKRKLEGMHGDALLQSRFPCPLLEGDACLAYTVRPVACRIYLSVKVSSCRTFYLEPAGLESRPALLDFPLRMGRMLHEGFRAALKARGIEAEEWRIEEGL